MSKFCSKHIQERTLEELAVFLRASLERAKSPDPEEARLGMKALFKAKTEFARRVLTYQPK